MSTNATSGQNAPTQTSKFYLPALASRSGEPGWLERLLTGYYQRHRRFLRQME